MATVHATDDALTIRKRRVFLRLLAFVIAIVAIVAAVNAKKPDGPMLGIGFGFAALLMLWGSEPITVEMQRSTDRFAIRYGGLFGLLARERVRPLSTVKYAETQTSSGSGMTSARSGGSRIVFILESGERVPLTFAFTSGDLQDNHQLEHAINEFLRPAKRQAASATHRQVVTSSGSPIQDALKKLLDTDGDGFVVIDDGSEDRFVQFANQSGGLELCWPADGVPIGEFVPQAIERLRAAGFHSVADANARGALAAMQPGTWASSEDGLYAQFGADAARAEAFALDVFANVFGTPDAKLNVSLN